MYPLKLMKRKCFEGLLECHNFEGSVPDRAHKIRGTPYNFEDGNDQLEYRINKLEASLKIIGIHIIHVRLRGLSKGRMHTKVKSNRYWFSAVTTNIDPFSKLDLDAVVIEAATPPGCVAKSGVFLISAPTTPSASSFFTTLSSLSTMNIGGRLKKEKKIELSGENKRENDLIEKLINESMNTSRSHDCLENRSILTFSLKWIPLLPHIAAPIPPPIIWPRPVALISAVSMAAASLSSTSMSPTIPVVAAASRASPIVIASMGTSSDRDINVVLGGCTCCLLEP
ncbi:hypothetical protein FXO37_00771 [Capsicum annuum]|nr:hypothetical protein FXO37_00771 [Capsicum annuum]